MLLLGRDGEDPLFLQVKEAQRLGARALRRHERVRRTRASRVVEGQRLMQAASDIFLGWVTANGLDGEQRDFYVRQLWDWKGSADVERDGADGAGACTPSSAAGPWRAPTPAPATAVAIAAYLGSGDTFDQAIADFAEAYADQNERDYAHLPRPPTAGGSPSRRASIEPGDGPARDPRPPPRRRDPAAALRGAERLRPRRRPTALGAAAIVIGLLNALVWPLLARIDAAADGPHTRRLAALLLNGDRRHLRGQPPARRPRRRPSSTGS